MYSNYFSCSAVLCSLFLAHAGTCFAASPFIESIVLEVDYIIEDLVITDLDGNGINDIVVTGGGEADAFEGEHSTKGVVDYDLSQVSIFLGRASPQNLLGIEYDPPIVIDVSNSPRGVAVGDLDKNGVVDIVTASIGTGDLDIIMGGKGAFNEISYSLFTKHEFRHSSDLEILDIDHDGVLDIVALSWNDNYNYDNYIYILYGNGNDGVWDGSFPDSTFDSYSLGGQAERLEMADFNSDGEQDFAIINNEFNFYSAKNLNAIGVLINKYSEGGRDDLLHGPLFIGYSDSLSNFDLANINGDDLVDVISDVDGGTFEGEYKGFDFESSPNVIIGVGYIDPFRGYEITATPLEGSENYYNPTSVDVNHDGYDDIVFTYSEYQQEPFEFQSYLGVRYGDGTGSFADCIDCGVAVGRSGDMEHSLLNDDDYPEIIIFSGDKIHILTNQLGLSVDANNWLFF